MPSFSNNIALLITPSVRVTVLLRAGTGRAGPGRDGTGQDGTGRDGTAYEP